MHPANHISVSPSKAFRYIWRPVEKPVIYFWTIFYRRVLKRNTIHPLQGIIRETDDEQRAQRYRDWAVRKTDETKYIQLAGGFLFTSITSCIQWPAAQQGHWSILAMFYSSLIFALLSVVNGSQQLLLLSTEEHEKARWKSMAQSVQLKVQGSSREGLNNMYIFALQAPIMLLTFAVMMFLSGVAGVVFSPLANVVGWSDEAKVASTFAIASVFALIIFYSTSLILHALLRPEPASSGSSSGGSSGG